MPTPEEAISLAEIVRTMKDFREEFRSAVGSMIRADVYRAEQATLRAEIAAQYATINQRLSELEGKIKSLEDDKRQNRGVAIGTFASAALALVLAFFNFKR